MEVEELSVWLVIQLNIECRHLRPFGRLAAIDRGCDSSARIVDGEFSALVTKGSNK
ncbi:hypothetical protein [Blastopirellula retiformator]|uniref:hypothetical protein n=1 Tax=Blastopirellula retiformator TaxID=2527970 RepID=UPI001646A8F3|nr:hypothetical protein [Blastopirellula retiformator]